MPDADRLARALAALDRLDAVEREATPGPWRLQIAAGDCDAPGYDDTSAIKGGGCLIVDQCDDLDAAAIVALRNLARPMLDLARAQCEIAVEYAAVEDGRRVDPADPDGLSDWSGYDDACGRRDAVLDALIDALAGGGEGAP